MGQTYDVIIIGAGAAGLMCAIEAGKRGKSVALLDHAQSVGEKIRISGGGRCNFTNIHAAPDRYISQNPHFCKSALSRYTPADFMALLSRHGVTWHEKTLGQLFCDGRSQAVIDVLLAECADAGVTIHLETTVDAVMAQGTGFAVTTSRGVLTSAALVIATGGPSIPKMGATGFAYDLARQFGLNVIETRAGLVPLTFTDDMLALTKELSGVAIDPSVVSVTSKSFREALLFTHRGLSGPSILQISSYWQPGEDVTINLCPDLNVLNWLKDKRQSASKKMLHTVLADILPERLAQKIAARSGHDEAMGNLSDDKLRDVATAINGWVVKPNGTEGYRTAEVTLGGVDTNALSSKTMEVKTVPGLYFIGEAVDVTGWLGGYNFQWAWASGFVAGQAV